MDVVSTMDKPRGDFPRPLPHAGSIMPVLTSVLSHPTRCETFSSLDSGPVRLCNNDYGLFLRFYRMGYVYAFRVNILAKMMIVNTEVMITRGTLSSTTTLESTFTNFSLL